MTYTAPEVLLMIAAIGGIIINSILAWRTGRVTDATLLKASVIEGHVNSKETKYIEQITSLSRENEILRGVIVDKDKTAALLAQSVIQSSVHSKSVDPKSVK